MDSVYTHDRLIRPLVLESLAGASWLREECHLGSPGRIDVSALVEGELVGLEIKAANDSLSRLLPPKGFQVDQFSAVYDRVTLVCAEKHLGKALAAIPSWWGVSVPRDGTLEPERPSERNPAPASRRLAGVLWVAEAREVARSLGIARGARSKWALVDVLAAAPEEALREALARYLPAREWRSPTKQIRL